MPPSTSSNPSQEIRIGYLLITTPQPNTFLGGILVTNQRGLPVEFWYTDPLQPNRLQQILYGKMLSQYLKQDVIVDSLFKNVDSKLKCLLVSDESLLETTAMPINVPVFRIQDTQVAPIGKPGQFQWLSKNELMLQGAAANHPLRVQFPPNSREEQTEALPSSAQALVEASQTMDITEPLKRIEKALETLCQEQPIAG